VFTYALNHRVSESKDVQMPDSKQTAAEDRSAATHDDTAAKRYGIRITLTEDNPMRRAHLLGDDWETFHWFSSAEERDEAYADMTRHLPNYRKGDTVGQVFEKIEQSP
jgi:hypothetical protein